MAADGLPCGTRPNSTGLLEYAPYSGSATPTKSVDEVLSPTKRFDFRRWFTKSKRREKEATSQTRGRYLDDEFTSELLLDSQLTEMVALPSGVDYNEWLATHTLSFFENVDVIYGCVTSYCSSGDCAAAMVSAGNIPYSWSDEKGRKWKCTAAQYVDYIMSYTQSQVFDQSIFPTKYGQPFPSGFEAAISKIHRLLHDVIVHLYQCHHDDLLRHRLHAHLNTLTYHFQLFNKHFQLIDNKQLETLDDLFQRLDHFATTRRKTKESKSKFSDTEQTNCDTEQLTNDPNQTVTDTDTNVKDVSEKIMVIDQKVIHQTVTNSEDRFHQRSRSAGSVLRVSTVPISDEDVHVKLDRELSDDESTRVVLRRDGPFSKLSLLTY